MSNCYKVLMEWGGEGGRLLGIQVLRRLSLVSPGPKGQKHSNKPSVIGSLAVSHQT